MIFSLANYKTIKQALSYNIRSVCVYIAYFVVYILSFSYMATTVHLHVQGKIIHSYHYDE